MDPERGCSNTTLVLDKSDATRVEKKGQIQRPNPFFSTREGAVN
jgi:hypothetical protein